jgi:hypothetical protein
MSEREESEGVLRRLVFPKDRSIGILTFKDEKGEYNVIGEAKGVVLVPARRWIKLMFSPEAARDLTPLTALRANDLCELGLNSTAVTDGQLSHVRGLTELLALGLSSTSIGNTGLAKLSTLSALQTLNLL